MILHFYPKVTFPPSRGTTAVNREKGQHKEMITQTIDKYVKTNRGL